MPRMEAKTPAVEKSASGDLPPVVPMRKRPWLLAIAVVCFAGWLLFLVAMALQP